MGKDQPENRNIEIYLRLKPVPKPARAVSADLVGDGSEPGGGAAD